MLLGTFQERFRAFREVGVSNPLKGLGLRVKGFWGFGVLGFRV